MCDTMVALSNATLDGSVIFAKNSDRQPNEPLLTIRVPRRRYGAGEKLKCTYIEIEQARETYEVLLLKPSWMWGAEMGGNEFGLNIGNEAVFTLEKQGPESLLGMDLLRLALERCQRSEQAVDLIVELLDRYGQGGNCGYEKKFFYHNSFLIADTESAWVLETAGKYWAAQKVKDVRSISNRLSIGSEFDRAHPDLIKNAVAKGWCKKEADFNFARCYTNRLITRFSGANRRESNAGCVLETEKGQITPATMKKILRSHEPGEEGRQFERHMLSSVCMHAGFIFGDHTTGSYVAHLKGDRYTYRLTGGSTPCLALYKPYWMTAAENFTFDEAAEKEALAFWLKRERLHRAVLENRVADLSGYLAERDQLESSLENKLATLARGSGENESAGGGRAVSEEELNRLMDDALQAENDLLDRVLARAEKSSKTGQVKGNPYFKYYWKQKNRKLFEMMGDLAGIP